MAGDQAGSSIEIHQLSQEISGLLVKTFTPDTSVRKTAEETILRLESSSKLYGIATLYLTRRDDLTVEVQTAAAIAFKNYIKRNWRYDPNDESSDQVDKIDIQQRELIKQHITKFMLESPAHIQRQLSEAITIIGQSDFPDQWPSLMPEMRAFLANSQEQNFNSLQGILQTAHSIFRRYRYELQTRKLWTEINLVMEHFAPPFTDRFKDLITAITNPPQGQQNLPALYKSLLLCCKIFHSLIIQDLPTYFEERLNIWMPALIELLKVPQNLFEGESVIEDMKSEICEIASLFVQRFSDAEKSAEYSRGFAENIWNLLVTTGSDPKYDTLVSNAIRYLVTVAQSHENRVLFQDANILNLVCQQVIIPNMTFREQDEELFEDDPDEYVGRDLEGSDVDTRRRAACDLVQALSRFLEPQLIEIFGRYMQEMFKNYEADKKGNWKHKDLAIFLYSSMAIKGSTRQHGTVTISQLVDVEKFLHENVICELTSDLQTTGSQVLRADALRYITTFRNHISMATLLSHLPLVLKYVTSSNIVVRTYASITLERLLTMRDPAQPKTTALKPEQFTPHLNELIKTLFEALDMPSSPENEHIMKVIMRLFSFLKSDLIVQFLPTVVPRLTTKLGEIARNPRKPYFNHYLFETLALTIRAACLQDSSGMRNEFESVLFNILNAIIAQDVQEFTPYLLQLLNIILRAQTVGAISDRFVKLFDEVLSPSLWEKTANVKPLTELLHTYIIKSSQMIVTQNKLDPVLGVFQKLLASKATDHEGLALLQTLMIHIPATDFDARFGAVLVLIFERLTKSKTSKLVKNVLVCFSLYAHLRGADLLATAVNRLQDKIFGMVLEKLYITEAKKVSGFQDRKICMCGMIKILSHLPLIENGAYNHLWAPLLLVLMETIELPPEVVNDDDDHFIDIAETLDFQAQYSKLNYASIKREDPTKDICDIKSLLAQSLSNLSTKVPGLVPKLLQDNLDQGVVSCLMGYCRAANVSI